MASSPSRTGPVAPSSARRAGRLFGHAIGVCPGGGRRHGRAHGWLGFLRGVFGFQGRRLLSYSPGEQQPFRTRFLASERFYVRDRVSVRAVLQLCAVCSRATAAKERRLLDGPRRSTFSAPSVVCCSSFCWYAPRGTSRSSATSLALNEPAQAALLTAGGRRSSAAGSDPN